MDQWQHKKLQVQNVDSGVDLSLKDSNYILLNHMVMIDKWRTDRDFRSLCIRHQSGNTLISLHTAYPSSSQYGA